MGAQMDRREIINNKEERPFAHYCAQYRQLDPQEAATRCGVAYDAQAGQFVLDFLGNRYAVGYPEFSVTVLDKRVPADQLSQARNAQILLLRYLLEGKKVPPLGKQYTYREMPWGELYNTQFTGRCIKRLAFSFGNDVPGFRRIMEALGATEIHGGDAGYALTLLDGLTVQFLIWAGDDEFPPSAQILFSDNFPEAFSAEDMAVVGDVTLNTMKEMRTILQSGGE